LKIEAPVAPKYTQKKAGARMKKVVANSRCAGQALLNPAQADSAMKMDGKGRAKHNAFSELGFRTIKSRHIYCDSTTDILALDAGIQSCMEK
jgi:hypothetical protein